MSDRNPLFFVTKNVFRSFKLFRLIFLDIEPPKTYTLCIGCDSRSELILLLSTMFPIV